ncbi:MAG: discoidin domain-containing protein [Phycisphaeraceae bacterium]|nr:discoidin domain-containing protein [Phycisphaeraceae bacterium]
MCKKLLFLLSCVLFLCITPSAKADLIAYWPFDEGSGDVAADIVGGFDAQLTNVDWVAGQFEGFALESDRSGDEIFAGPGPTPTTEDLSLAWWMVDNYDSYQTIMNKYEGDSVAGNGILLRPESEDRPLRWRLGGWQAYGGWGEECGVPQGAYNDAEWTHVVCTYDSAADTATIYINGVVPVNTDNPQWNPKTGIAGPNGYCEGLNDPLQPLLIVGQQELYGGILDEVAIWDHALSADEVQSVLTLGPLMLDPRSSSKPGPEDEAGDIARDLTLTWSPGEAAVTRNVFLGTTLEDVENASVADALGTTVGQDLTDSEWNPGRLEFGQTYFWRVDEVSGTEFKGGVWSFTTEPHAYQIEAITATASSQQGDAMGPEKTIDGSGLDELDQHGTSDVDMWLSAGDASSWIQYEFDKAQSITEMWVWNSNQGIEQALGLGAKDATIEVSVDGENWTALEGEFQFAQAPGTEGYARNTVVDFGGTLAKYVKLNISGSYGPLPQVGLSEVRFFNVPVFARELAPADGTVDVDPVALLSWRAGREAGSHEVYISTDEQAVIDGTAPVESVTDASYTASLDLGETYYWKVNEVNTLEDPATWEGNVLSFSTIPSVSVDDFEGYDNASPTRPFQTWLDGIGYSADEFFTTPYGGNGTGAAIGHDVWSLSSPHYDGSIMETTATIAGSGQALPFYFDGASETQRTFAPAQDWTSGSVTTLAIAVRGNVNLGAATQLYLKINNTKVTYGGDLSVPIYGQWLVDLSALGIDLTSVTTLSFGVEGGGSGLILLDDIALHRAAPSVVEPPAGSDKALVAHWTLDETEGLTAADSSGYGNHGELIGMTGTEWTTGHASGALEFDGTQIVNCGTGNSLGFSGNVTISAWVKMNADNTDVYMGIGGKLRSGPSQGFALVRHSSNVFRLWADNGAGELAGFEADSDATYTDTEWHHVAGVVDGSTSTLYVDGVKQAKQGVGLSMTNSGQHAYIGIQYSEDTIRMWDGLIDDVRIYYRALSEQEILGL